ncbi:MAG: hypothetical protein GC160_02895 [Acidobacteria bacterium]|nr:hypothetical protein [Acidobacteriota bacterium]
MRLDGWIEVFRAGDYGAKGEWTADDVARIAASYDRSYHESPLVLGHPKTDAPAYGWVDQLKAEGGTLLAKLRDVPAELGEAVRAGRWRKRSVALYRDLDGKGPYLRHLGLLGAEPPAVKGLQPAFGEAGDAAFLEIEQEARKTMDLSEVRRAMSEALTEFGERLGLKKPEATAEAVKAAVAEQAAAIRAELETGFSEREKEMQKSIDELKAANEKISRSGAENELLQFVEKAANEGRLTPAALPAAKALAALLAGHSTTVEFGEGDAKKSVTAGALFGELLAKLPVKVEFRELTGSLKTAAGGEVVEFSAPAPGVEVEGVDLAARAQRIAADRKLEFGDALKLARRELQGVA